MLKIHCDMCGKELKEPGGLLFSPPNENSFCQKIHLCQKCYKTIENFINSYIINQNNGKNNYSNNGK